ncbi:MAG: membrane protein insertase YidC [Ahrensia sp.]|nr:membrane protein insertase YidC [Ahrensia sp.]
MDNQRNFLLAAVLSLGVVFLWQMFIIQPRVERERAIAEQQQAQLDRQTGQNADGAATPQSGNVAVPSGTQITPQSDAGTVPGSTEASAPPAQTAGRVELRTEKLDGSINLRGARVDRLNLALYRQTVDPTSPEIQLLFSGEKPNAYFAEFGFSPNDNAGDLPGPTTVWTLKEGDTLTQNAPITLEYANDKGLTFNRTISLDDDYMFTIVDSITNTGDAAISLTPYGRIARYGTPETAGIFVLHEGLIGNVGEEGLDEFGYDDVEEEPNGISRPRTEAGWLGITDKYWATALVPGRPFTSKYRYVRNQRPFYQTEYLQDPVNIAPGATQSISNRLFAGAKKVEIIDRYEAEGNIPHFDKIIDWGWLYFLTKPLFQLMEIIYKAVGNFGVAILLVTVLIKIVFFPLANKSYASMANMKKVQPQMQALKERHGDDRQALQKSMMELYKKEKINPAAGCWPILIQIPVFFALYKVIYVTIEMRHAPFFGWIQDLSAPDPTSFINLFGLLPFESPAALALIAVGVWPLIMGITMFIQMQMNPQPPDPTQQMIFKWMPVVFTFMLATFPAGLVIYWAWNNFLSILQQGAIMKRQGAKIELWDNLKGMFGRKKKEETG